MSTFTRSSPARRGTPFLPRCRNAFLTAVLASLSSRAMRARMWRGREVDNALDVTRDEHRRIYEAVANGDPELARAAATAHIASGERWLRAQLAAAAGNPPGGGRGA